MVEKIQRNAVAIISVAILGLIGVAISVYAAPIHVLKDWKIAVEDKTYNPGDSIYVKSKSVKLRKATGEAKRLLRCMNDLGSTDYPINETIAIRGPGTRQSNREVKIPNTLAGLPVKCRVVIEAKYPVYWIRIIKEKTESNTFTVVAKPEVKEVIYIDRTTQQTFTSAPTQIFQTTQSAPQVAQKESVQDTPPLTVSPPEDTGLLSVIGQIPLKVTLPE